MRKEREEKEWGQEEGMPGGAAKAGRGGGYGKNRGRDPGTVSHQGGLR